MFMSSGIGPESAVGEMVGNIHHHISNVHALTDKMDKAVDKAEKVVGGSLKDKVRTGAVVARKALRTGAKVAEVTALPAGALGLATGNAALVEYAEIAPLAGEAASLTADGLGQTIKTL